MALAHLARLLTRREVRRVLWVVMLCVLLSFVPLVGTLGYESSLVLAPMFAFWGTGIGMQRVNAAREQPERGTSWGQRLSDLAARIASELTVIAVAAVGVLLLGQLWQPNCDPWRGLAFFVLGPLFAGMFGAVAGMWGAVLARRRAWQWVLASAPFWLCTGVALWRFYAHPVVFAHDPFWGYFSGAIYDEDVGISGIYLRYRAYNLLAASTAVLAWALLVDPQWLRPRVPRFTRKAAWLGLATVLMASTCCVIAVHADRLGFTATRGSIERTLSRSKETEHFVIHYAPNSPTAREIDAVAGEHEFAWSRLRQRMQREPAAKVHSFVFTSPAQKRALMGAGHVEIAAPWRHQIYLNHRPFPHPVVHHELAHVFAGTMGDAVFKVSRSGLRLNLALVEGVATALAPRSYDGLDLHDQAAALDRLGKRPPLASIMGTGFWSQASRHAYTAAGSFTAWLLDAHGIEPLARLYASAGDFVSAYGKELSALEREWKAFLDARPVDAAKIAAMAQRFNVQPVFARPCAHKTALLYEAIAVAFDRGADDEVVTAYDDLCRLEPERVEHRIGYAQALLRMGKIRAALPMLEQAAAFANLTVTLQSLIAERLGDVWLQLGQLAHAHASYRAALTSVSDDDRMRILQLKQLGTTDRELAPLVRDYFLVSEQSSDAAARAVVRLHAASMIQRLPAHRTLGDYLVARQLLNIAAPRLALTPLMRTTQRLGPPLPSPEFERAAALALAEAHLRVDEPEQAAAALSRVPATTSSGDRSELALWHQRVAHWHRAIEDRAVKDPG